MRLTSKVAPWGQALALSVVALVTAGLVEARSIRIVAWDERQPKRQ
ncbi:MAG: hypothetical protein OEW48_08010 [Phycisphaerae bacterium]|nr:hypothetical protein [Phycisphaerae bacterium]